MTAADVMSAHCDSSSSACSLRQVSCHSDSVTSSNLLKSYSRRVALSSTVRQLINLLNRKYCEHSVSLIDVRRVRLCFYCVFCVVV